MIATLVLATLGLSALITQSEFFTFLRDWGERIKPRWPRVAYLTTCMQCQSVWIGACFGIVGWYLGDASALEAWCVPFAASGLGWVTQIVMYRLLRD